MNNEVVKILRLVEKGLITKEQGYILIKAHYENAKKDFDYENLDSSLLGASEEDAIESSAELIDEFVEAAKGAGEDSPETRAYTEMLDGFVKEVVGRAIPGDEGDGCEEQEDNNNFLKRDFYLAGEKVYDQRNVSLKNVRRGKRYKANFFVYQIKDSDGSCIEDKSLQKIALELINEGFCGRYSKIKNGSVTKIFIE